MFQGWWQRRREGERARTAGFQPSVEALEDRMLLSATLVGDINRTTQPAFSPGPAQVSSASAGGWTYFSASDGQHANELWRSNGTASGTVLVRAIDGPGLTADASSTIDHLTALGNQVIFTVDDGIHGNELWISDGTAAGTHLLQDINKGLDSTQGGLPAGSNARDFVVAGNRVFFTAEDATHGRELWVTDGTSDGTYLVRDLDPLNSAPYSDGPSDLTAFGDRVYFYARDAEHGRELWTSDGTKDGTRLVADLNRGPGDGAPQDSGNDWPGAVPHPMMTVMGNTLYFVGDNGYSGAELWATDGTWRGTRQVRDIRSGTLDGSPAGSNPQSLTTVDSAIYFTADDGIHGQSLWVSDGTSRGTHLVTPPKGAAPGDMQEPRQLTAFGHQLGFITTTAAGAEGLWVTDGTAADTHMLKEIAPAGQAIFPPLARTAVIPWFSNSQDMLANGNTLYFTAVDAAHGRELWKTNGTPDGTALVRDIRPGPAGSQIGLLAARGDHILLVANDGRTGRELWTSDGTYEATRLIRDINRQPNDASPSNPVQAGNNLFFSADDGLHGAELWATDLTTGQTRLVKDINTTFGPSWNLGGDTEPAGSNIHSMVALNGLLYFVADDGVHGDELWVSDGTSAGTHMVKDVNTAPPRPWIWLAQGLNGGSSIDQVVAMNGALYFSADDGVHGRELWASDGTADGTHLVTDINTHNSGFQHFPIDTPLVASPPAHLTSVGPWWNTGNDSSSPSNLTVLGNHLYFAANDGDHGNELWVSDGSAGGTYMVKNINPEPPGPNQTPQDSNPANLTRVGSDLYFTADDGKHGTELWRTDGTWPGTRMVRDINRTTSTPSWSNVPIPGSAYPSNLTAAGHTLYFTADDGVNGLGLWKTDGSGAVLVCSLGTAPDGSQVSVGELTASGGKMFFASDAGGAGTELWTSDGTSAGTHRVVDLYPGSATIPYAPYTMPNSSLPSNLTDYKGKVYFIAEDATHGRELWSSDGTVAGTVLVQDVTPGQGSGFNWSSGITVIGDTLYFSGSDGQSGMELWKLA